VRITRHAHQFVRFAGVMASTLVLRHELSAPVQLSRGDCGLSGGLGYGDVRLPCFHEGRSTSLGHLLSNGGRQFRVRDGPPWNHVERGHRSVGGNLSGEATPLSSNIAATTWLMGLIEQRLAEGLGTARRTLIG
jgi:hypothetical protein